MASRRVRIKGIANIPPRGKPQPNSIEIKEETNSTVNEETKSPIKEETLSQSVSQPLEQNVELNSKPAENCKEISQSCETIVVEVINNNTVSDDSQNTQTKSKENGIVNDSQEKKPQFPARRRFIKPIISANVIRGRNKPKVDEVKSENEVGNEINDKPPQIPTKPTVETNNKIVVQGITKLPNVQQIEVSRPTSDTEYPPPALSPTKFLNRSRIKAVPRLGQQRRTSFSIGSASESEDDSRRIINRIRNDSVCSAVSGINELPVIENASPRRKPEFSTVIQRKCKRTEQSRKLAEARRDFQIRFSKGKPDRQRLTMIDLIFYNPATAPMSQKKKRRLDTESGSIKEDDDDGDEDEVEIIEPAIKEQEKNSLSDEENTLPAPQITIGENGEIIVDEKSLLIENKEMKKNREALKQSELVDGDFDTNFGVYKRVKRTRDWSKAETLRFYKALNTIGTDFTLMCELFPDRSRRELKMKFKKEERMNRPLIDRAVMQPIEFDMTDLRREVEMDKFEKMEAERLKREKEKYKSDQARKPKRRKTTSVSKLVDTDSDDDVIGRKMESIKNKRPSFVKGGINSIIDDSDSDSWHMSRAGKVQQTRSGRVSMPTKQSNNTTSVGKHPLIISMKKDASGEPIYIISTLNDDGNKVEIDLPSEIKDNLLQSLELSDEVEVILQRSDLANDINKQINEIINKQKINQDTTKVDDDENVEPGSIMILTNLNDKGETCYSIYSVNEDGEKIPIDLAPEILDDLTPKIANLNGQTTNKVANQSSDSLENVSLISDLNITTQDMSDSIIIPFEEFNQQEWPKSTATLDG